MTEPTTGESRGARRQEREESFGLPMRQVAGIAAVLVALAAVLFLAAEPAQGALAWLEGMMAAHPRLVASVLGAAALASLVIPQLREAHSAVAEMPVPPRRVSMPVRILCGGLVFALLAAIVLFVMAGPVDFAFTIVPCLIMAVIAVWLGLVAVRGEYSTSSDQQAISASPRFSTLADPSRPLPDDAAVSGGRQPHHAPRVSDDPPVPRGGKPAIAE